MFSSKLCTLSPRAVVCGALSVAGVTAPVALFLLVAWLLQWESVLPVDRPYAVIMLYLLLLHVGVVAFGVAIVAALYHGIAGAFTAGVRTGRQQGPVAPVPATRAPRAHREDSHLQAVPTPHIHEHSVAQN